MEIDTGFMPDHIVYEVDDWVFVVGDENRVDVQLLNPKLHPNSVYLIPLKLFTLNNGMVRMDCDDPARQIWVRADIRRDGLVPPDVFDLDTEPSLAIRLSRDWCLNVILAAAD